MILTQMLCIDPVMLSEKVLISIRDSPFVNAINDFSTSESLGTQYDVLEAA